MNEKRELLRSLIRESIQEVQDEDHEYQEQQEVMSMKRIQSYAHWGLAHIKTNPAEVVQEKIFDKIVQEIDGLVKAHEAGKEVSNVNMQQPSTTAALSINEKSPPGFSGTVKAMKKHKDITNPFALAWWQKNRGYKSHKKA
jgi:hypothetical protein